LQFATGNDVEPGAHACKDIENGEIGVGLDREADERTVAGRVATQYVLEFSQRGFQSGSRIDVGWRAKLFGKRGEGHRFGVQDAIFQRE
jgi:hypothetical protein